MDDQGFVGFDTTDIEIEEEEVEGIDSIAPKYDLEQSKVAINAVGRAVIGNEEDAYRFWIIKCLLTERYKYLAYDTDFGVEIEEIIGSNYPQDIAESEIQRTISEALMIDDRTVSVENFNFEWKGDSVLINFEIQSIFETTEIYELMTGGEQVGTVSISVA